MRRSAPFAFRLLLGRELRLWAEAGHAPVLWWRDDDARATGEALDKLLDFSRRHSAPLTLAAIAGPHLPALVRRVEREASVEIAIHGFKHINRQPEGRGFGEVVPEDSLEWVRAQLRATVMAFHRAGAQPTLFVPPWNNLAPQVVEAIGDSAITAVSAFDQEQGYGEGVARLDAHLDVLRWKGGGRFRGRWRFLSRMRRLMAERRLSRRWDEPMGLLTHHLDHDAATWAFLEQFLAAFPIQARQDVMSAAPRALTALSA
ncbi:polysaccharide deacetylase family protein [Caulobacter sp. BP25]|uniref:polysaccharide deacetylase family protein n=1 Tax=Caulobacter sp. BP25 TaxID=2048900 RepID=UPI000C129F05|nr:polysaccharide deacetylase family protein [Caulobacter sp. BP25]PHY18209.1 polysaccharide deacetylase [Caulobacter sp. BP25]